MDNQQRIDDLVRHIYKAVTDGDEWGNLLQVVASHFHSAVATFVDQNQKSGHGYYSQCLGDEHYYGAENNELIDVENLDVGVVSVDQLGWDDNEHLVSRTHSEFGREFQTVCALSLPLSKTDSWITLFKLQRSATEGVYTKDEVEQLTLLAPHLTQAFMITREIRRKELLFSVFEQAFNNLSDGALLLEQSGNVVFANKAAEHIFQQRNGITILNGSLVSETVADSGLLPEWLQKVLAPLDEKPFDTISTSSIAGANGEASYQVSVMPLVQESFPVDDNSQLGLIIIRDSETSLETHQKMLGELYGLTKQEALISSYLCQGMTTEQVTSESNTSLNTVRTHIKSVYRKTQTHSQAQLAAKVLFDIGSAKCGC